MINTHIPGISLHYFPKDVAIWPNGRVSIVDIEEILPFTECRRPYAPFGSEGGCYAHIPLDKSGEDNQRIQLKRMLIKVPVPTP